MFCKSGTFCFAAYTCTVGQIVAGNFDTTKVFSRYHIDFCCHGNTPFAEACRNRGIDPEAVARELNELQENTVSNVLTLPDGPSIY